VDELQARMSHAEYVAWVAFAESEPLPAARADLHTAMILWLLTSIHRKKGAKAPKLDKFIMDYWQEARSPRRLEAKLRALTVATGDEPPSSEPATSSARVIRGNNGRRP
jgi:hypothetical protein